MTAFRAIHLDEVEPLRSQHGCGVQLIRRTLGITAFGVNAYRAEAAGGQVIEEHDELGAGAGLHEELYVVQSGHAVFTIGGVEHDAPAGTLVFVSDPAARRGALAAEAGTVVLVIGGQVGEPYLTPAWEAWFAAQKRADVGDTEGAIAILAEEQAARPDNATTLYNRACFEALGGRREAALAHVVEAIERDPKLAEFARTDTDLDTLRDDPRLQ